VTLLPFGAAPLPLGEAPVSGPRLSYFIELPHPGAFTVEWQFLPTHPIAGDALRLAYAIDDGPTQLAELRIVDGDAAWADGVLDAVRTVETPWAAASAGRHVVHLYGIDPGVVLDAIVVREAPAAVTDPK
jgi:hypothetical protein